ncbi:hypothetical protein PINS_up013204 [Pythium insidiosum]|nr:hypothetical protein PINS_up013204 [Pythium insidiosum]
MRKSLRTCRRSPSRPRVINSMAARWLLVCLVVLVLAPLTRADESDGVYLTHSDAGRVRVPGDDGPFTSKHIDMAVSEDPVSVTATDSIAEAHEEDSSRTMPPPAGRGNSPAAAAAQGQTPQPIATSAAPSKSPAFRSAASTSGSSKGAAGDRPNVPPSDDMKSSSSRVAADKLTESDGRVRGAGTSVLDGTIVVGIIGVVGIIAVVMLTVSRKIMKMSMPDEEDERM